MSKFISIIFFAIFSPFIIFLKLINNLIKEIHSVTDTSIISPRGWEILNSPELKEEMERQMQDWRDSGGRGYCIIDLSKRHYKREFLLEKTSHNIK